MKAQVLHSLAPISEHPLVWSDVPVPSIGSRDLLVRVHACAICHTDLHIIEGEQPDPKLPLIPGHQIVGIVEAIGNEVSRFQPGARVGIPWLHETCGKCEYCRRRQENLCLFARFTGYTADGGYAEFTTIREDFAVPLPDRFSDIEVAPLLCAGIVGYRSLRLAGIQPNERVGLYGFGASAHICIQALRHWNCEVFVFTRGEEHQQLARALGAAWVGQAQDQPPRPLDRSVVFAPAGWIVPLALNHLRYGGTLCINAIHMSAIPEMPYELLWHERVLRTVANATREDAELFLPLAAEIPIRAEVEVFPLAEANRALELLKRSQLRAAAVLTT